MGIYEGLKDAITIAQKVDNIDLYKKLLDLSKEALDMQDQISKLQAEIIQLKNAKELEERVEYHKLEDVDELHTEYPYVTLKNDPLRIRYCAVCWGKDGKLIQLKDELNCICCNMKLYRR